MGEIILSTTNLRTSFTAAESIPIKVVLDEDVQRAARAGKIIPIHLQWNPTNKCNLHCQFCSCEERNRNLEMAWEDAVRIIAEARTLGTKAVTITGGGEPMCYPRIADLVDLFVESGIKVGLVTNGIKLGEMPTDSLRRLTWCRISNADERNFTSQYARHLDSVVSRAENVDWAFSHVVGQKPNLASVKALVEFANWHSFTHVRVVGDILQPDQADVALVSGTFKKLGVDDSRVIYQTRQQYVAGGSCYICYLKPVISPDCKVYACCGVQYALATPSRDLPEELCLGDAHDLAGIVERSGQPFDGSLCVKCYYQSYNQLLAAMMGTITHKEFV